MNRDINRLKTSIRVVTLLFMAALMLSGITAVPLQYELNWLLGILPKGEAQELIARVLTALTDTGSKYNFLFYGYDWLAFAHIVIALNFIGVLINPVKNIWVIDFGVLACALVIPFALVVGGMRGLPIWWRFIDCSFGIVGFMPLWYCRKMIVQLKTITEADRLNIIF